MNSKWGGRLYRFAVKTLHDSFERGQFGVAVLITVVRAAYKVDVGPAEAVEA